VDEHEGLRTQTEYKLREDPQLLKIFESKQEIIKFKVLVLNYIASQLPQKEIMLLGKVFLEIDKNKDGYLTV
jgi:hypothetical protein